MMRDVTNGQAQISHGARLACGLVASGRALADMIDGALWFAVVCALWGLILFAALSALQ